MCPTEHPGRGRDSGIPKPTQMGESPISFTFSVGVPVKILCIKRGFGLGWKFTELCHDPSSGGSAAGQEPVWNTCKKGGMKAAAPEARLPHVHARPLKTSLREETELSLSVWGSISWLHIMGCCLVSLWDLVQTNLMPSADPESQTIQAQSAIAASCLVSMFAASSNAQPPSEAAAYPEVGLWLRHHLFIGVSPLRVSPLPPEP